jgi:hypothetical protein
VTKEIGTVRIQTVSYNVHPSTKPLKRFHGYMIKKVDAFNSCYADLIKKIILIAVSPIGYTALSFIALAGYPYKTKATKQVKIIDLASPEEKTNKVTKQLIKNACEGLKELLHSPKRAKCIVSVSQGENQIYFEINIPEYPSIDEAIIRQAIVDKLSNSREHLLDFCRTKFVDEMKVEALTFWQNEQLNYSFRQQVLDASRSVNFEQAETEESNFPLFVKAFFNSFELPHSKNDLSIDEFFSDYVIGDLL